MAVTLSNGVVVPNADGREPISETGIAELRMAGVSADAAIGAVRAVSLAAAEAADVKAVNAAQIATDADAHSRDRDRALEDLIDGVEGMTYVGAWESGRAYRINDVVSHGGDSWARLTAGSEGTPGGSPTHWGLVARKGDGGGFGELSETDVTGLWEGSDNGFEARLSAAAYDSGERDITSRMSGVISGRVLVWRLGRTVHLTFDQLVVEVPDTPAWLTVSGLLTVGFRGAGRNRFYQFAQQVSSRAAGPIRIDTGGSVVIYNSKAGNGRTLVIEGTVSFPTSATLPTSLPGDAA